MFYHVPPTVKKLGPLPVYALLLRKVLDNKGAQGFVHYHFHGEQFNGQPFGAIFVYEGDVDKAAGTDRFRRNTRTNLFGVSILLERRG